MSKSVAALACAAMIALGAAPTLAGVVITEQETTTGGPQAHSVKRTLMVQGNKERVVTPQHEFIIDLDQGVMYLLDPAAKSYFELPFPPNGAVAHLVGGPAMHTMNFAKTGKHRTVTGYPCEDYAGSGNYMMAEFSIVSCVSNKAPGAPEFNAFQKALAAKLKTASVEMPSTMPQGIPLAEDTTAKFVMGGPDAAKLPPAVAERLKNELAHRPPMVTKTAVTKISLKKLGGDTFRPPAGFTKSEPPMAGHPPMNHPPQGGSSAAPPSSAP